MSAAELVSPLAERSRLRAQLWRFNRNRVLLYRAIVRLRNDGGGRQFVDRSTDIVVDGFERSGNTFAYLAFCDANPGLTIGHHTHSPAQFYWAARWHVPAILLVRDPAEVALSVALRWPARSVASVIDDWTSFHRRVQRLRPDHILVAPFEVVVQDFGSIIAELNTRCGTRFTRFDPGVDATDRVYQAIEARNARRYGQVTEVAVARPSVARQDATRAMRSILERPEVQRRLVAAQALRNELTGSPVWTGRAR